MFAYHTILKLSVDTSDRYLYIIFHLYTLWRNGSDNWTGYAKTRTVTNGGDFDRVQLLFRPLIDLNKHQYTYLRMNITISAIYLYKIVFLLDVSDKQAISLNCPPRLPYGTLCQHYQFSRVQLGSPFYYVEYLILKTNTRWRLSIFRG